MQKLTTNDALSYLKEVKHRFADRKGVYDTFLEIMKEFKAQRIDTNGVIARVKGLFKGHRELILGFNTFLPKGYEIELARISDDEDDDEPAQREHQAKQPVEFDQAINYVNKIKNRFSNEERVYKAFLEILNMYRKGQKTITEVYEEVAVLFRLHHDLLEEFTYFLPDNSNSGIPPPPGMRPGGDSISRSMGSSMGRRGGGNAGGMGGGQRNMMGGGSPIDHSRMVHKRKAARKAEEGFRRMEHDEEGYGMRGGSAGLGGGNSGGRPLSREMKFLESVKGRLRSKELYNDFLKVLNLHSSEVISRQEMTHMVADLLGRNPDIMAQFQQFVAGCENIDPSDLNGATLGRPMPVISNRDMLKQKLQKDKFMTKPLSELVAMETERITPSYVKMPPGYPKLHHSGRTALGDEVLNDQFVNVITGSEDYSFKLMRKNQYEEALFRCEDDRYEFEMVIEQNNSTIRVLQPVVDKLQDMTSESKAMFRLDYVKGLNLVHMGHIQRLYGEQGLVLVDLLHKNPVTTIPLVLHRLRNKEAEWRKINEDMTRIWKKIYEQNYSRSLDHRSFYFKQQEKKTMMIKAMISDVKEAADKRKVVPQHLQCLSMAKRYVQPAAPLPDGQSDLSFPYTDKLVFEDVYAILRAAIEQGLNPGMREQVLLLYIQNVEPIFGVRPRTHELEKLRMELEADKDTMGDGDMADARSSSSEQDGNDEGATGGEDNGKTPPPGMEEKNQGPGHRADEGRGGQSRVKRSGSPDHPLDQGPQQPVNDKEDGPFKDCKPLMPWLGPQGRGTGANHYIPPTDTRLLFGNENIYLFFRYHRYLYERLCLARKFCLEIATKKITAPTRPLLTMGQPLPLAGSTTGEGGETGPDPIQEAAIREEADKIHASFIATVHQVLGPHHNQQDQGAFEDSVRGLLGTNSYELFTLDKLLSKLVKHMQGMVQDDATTKLWEMFRYEQARSSPICAAMYHVNCHTVLEDACFKIEFRDSDCMLHFQMNDPEKTDPHSVIEGAPTPYIQGYVSLGPTPASLLPSSNLPTSPLYLKRNLPSGQPIQEDDVLMAALHQVIIRNGLECKIACQTDKVSYVLDTEDVMVRKRRKLEHRKAGSADTRKGRFDRWLTNASGGRGGVATDRGRQTKEEEEAVQALVGTMG